MVHLLQLREAVLNAIKTRQRERNRRELRHRA